MLSQHFIYSSLLLNRQIILFVYKMGLLVDIFLWVTPFFLTFVPRKCESYEKEFLYTINVFAAFRGMGAI